MLHYNKVLIVETDVVYDLYITHIIYLASLILRDTSIWLSWILTYI